MRWFRRLRKDKPDECPKCMHSFDNHLMVATTGDLQDGGVMLCPKKNCDCYHTWGFQGNPTKHVPDRFELELIKEKVL